MESLTAKEITSPKDSSIVTPPVRFRSAPATPLGGPEKLLTSMQERVDQEVSKNQSLSEKVRMLELQLQEKAASQPPTPSQPVENPATAALLEKALDRMDQLEKALESQAKPTPSSPSKPSASSRPSKKAVESRDDEFEDDDEEWSDEEGEETSIRTPSGQIASLHISAFQFIFVLYNSCSLKWPAYCHWCI